MPDRSWLGVDRARLPRGRLEHVVDAAQADGQAQQVAQELDDAAVRAAADQRQRDDHLAQPGLGHRQLEQHRLVGRRRREGVIQRRAGLVRLLVDELAAHPVPGGQVADRLRTGQRLDGQVLAVALGQRPDRRANTSVHTRPTDESPSGAITHPGSANPASRVTRFRTTPSKLQEELRTNDAFIVRWVSRELQTVPRAHSGGLGLAAFAAAAHSEPVRSLDLGTSGWIEVAGQIRTGR